MVAVHLCKAIAKHAINANCTHLSSIQVFGKMSSNRSIGLKLGNKYSMYLNNFCTLHTNVLNCQDRVKVNYRGNYHMIKLVIKPYPSFNIMTLTGVVTTSNRCACGLPLNTAGTRG